MSTQDQLDEALAEFSRLMTLAREKNVLEPTAMTLATADAGGRVSARTVLLKGFDRDGFVFYTNLNSDKVAQLRANVHAALCFLWKPIQWQVRIEGKTSQVDDREADAYWATRPRGSQAGAWASDQSKVLPDRDTLVRRNAEIEQQYAGQPIPRPPHWSGLRVVPDLIEFWNQGEFRLHDRIRYRIDSDRWLKERLYP